MSHLPADLAPFYSQSLHGIHQDRLPGRYETCRKQVVYAVKGYCQLDGTGVALEQGMTGIPQAAVAALHSLKERSRNSR